MCVVGVYVSNAGVGVCSVHVVFGQVCAGAALVRQLEALPVDRNARPLQDVLVSSCGQLVRLKTGSSRSI